jgi:hypothetical protein
MKIKAVGTFPEPVQKLLAKWGDNACSPDYYPDQGRWVVRGYWDHKRLVSYDEIDHHVEQAELLFAACEVEDTDIDVAITAVFDMAIPELDRYAKPPCSFTTDLPLQAVTFFLDRIDDKGRVQVRFNHNRLGRGWKHHNYWITLRQMQLLVLRLTLLGYEINQEVSRVKDQKMVFYCPVGRSHDARVDYYQGVVKRVPTVLHKGGPINHRKAYRMLRYVLTQRKYKVYGESLGSAYAVIRRARPRYSEEKLAELEELYVRYWDRIGQ